MNGGCSVQSQIDTGRDYAVRFMNQVIDALPRFLGALLVLIIGYIVAKVLQGGVHRLLVGVNLDERLHSGKGGNIIQRAVPSPTMLASRLTFWVIFFFTISIAVSVLGIPALIEFVRAIYAYIPNVIGAVLIFLVAGAVSAGVITLARNTLGDTPIGKIVASATPIVVMGIAVFMILNQLQIAKEIVIITYTALVGSAALGMALAFGLGGRDVAAQMLQGLYEAGRRHTEIAKRHLRAGAAEAKRRVEQL